MGDAFAFVMACAFVYAAYVPAEAEIAARIGIAAVAGWVVWAVAKCAAEAF
jgi:hypothetical protein